MENKENNNDDEKKFNPLDILNKLKSKKGVTNIAKKIPKEFSECDIVYKTCLGHPKDDNLPIHLGVNSSNNTYILQIGTSKEILIMSEEHLFFFMDSLSLLVSSSVSDKYSLTESQIVDKIEQVRKSFGKPNLGKGSFKETTEQIKEFFDKEKAKMDSGSKPKINDEDKEEVKDEDGNDIKLKEIFKKINRVKEIEEEKSQGDISEELEKEMEASREDIQKVMESLTPEEQEEVQKQMSLKREEILLKKSKEFEKQLLGELEIEGEIEYNYDYFSKIYKEQGLDSLKEELAKIPKNERMEMIEKIMAEYENKKKQKN